MSTKSLNSSYGKLANSEVEDRTNAGMFPGQQTVSLRSKKLGASSSFPAQEEAVELLVDNDGQEAQFVVRGIDCHASLESTGISLTPARSWKSLLGVSIPRHIPYTDLLSATLLDKLPYSARITRWVRRKKGGLALAVHTYSSGRRRPARWKYLCLALISQDPAVARGWVTEINSIIRSISGSRPSRVLSLVNPKGGAKRAQNVWLRKAQPLLHLAGVECVTQMTEYGGHAHEMVANMSLQDLEAIDGILAVGGDGLFQEVVDGLLALRKEGGPRANVAEGLRLAQIPAGSTDAVAWTANGTRSVEAAALHVALGEGGSLDVMRVDSGDGQTRHSVCYAAYGYMGDLMRRSERWRWMGPIRYTLAGAVTFLQARSYNARISCAPAADPGSLHSGDVVECTIGCTVCASGAVVAGSQNAFSRPASHSLRKSSSLREIHGKFRSIMAVVTPCRSDLSPAGLSSGSHLADGRIRLILVKQCSQWDYLRFLVSIPKSGVRPGVFDFVEIIDVTALRVVPSGHQSSWNVDGELLKNNNLEANIHRGLVRIFSMGVPT